MSIYKSTLNKDKLLLLPEEERNLLISIAHLQNEIRFSLYGVVWTHDFTSDNKMIIEGQIAFNFYHLKILAGKLHEGWLLLNKTYFCYKSLTEEFRKDADKEAIELLGEIKSYFKKSSNSISKIRNKLAFHYSYEHLAMHLPNLQDDLNLYIAEENDANTLYYFAEALANRAVLSTFEIPDGVNPLEILNSEVIGIAKKFNKFNMHLLKFIIHKNSPEIFNGVAEKIEMNDLKLFKEVNIPFFTDTREGFI